jgi:protein-tyrosine phosphatase
MVNVLFVCMGNICRSPTAQGMFTKLLEEHRLSRAIRVDSAGTHAYHIGEPPDRRAQQAALRRGVDLSPLMARQVYDTDFHEFDYILAMDRDNLADLQAICPPQHSHKLHLFLDFAPDHPEDEVPDPYYGNKSGFERVLDLTDAAARGLLLDICRRQLGEA